MITSKNLSTDSSLDLNKLEKKINAAHIGMDLNDLNDHTIIYNDRSGQPVFLSALYWDLQQLSLVPTDLTTFNFAPFSSPARHNLHNIRMAQTLLSTGIFSLGYTGRPPRISTIRANYKALRALTASADKKNITIQELISAPEHIDFINELSGNNASNIAKILKAYLKKTKNALKFDPHNQLYSALKKRHAQKLCKKKQTPVIPSRILHARYHHYNNVIHDFVEHSDKLTTLISQLASDPFYSRDSSKASRSQLRNYNSALKITRINFADAMTQHKVAEYCKKYGISSTANISAHLSLVQHSAKCLVHIYTLVRDHEAKLLEDDCIKPAEGWGGKGLYMMGISTKLTGIAKDTAWIANELIVEPIKALQLVKEIILPYIPMGTPGSECLLVTPTYLPMCVAKPGNTIIPETSTRYEKYLPDLLIEESDINELEAIDPLGDWRSDKKYQVGKPWRITSHQFRRTMAVFAAQSQILDIPELKRLLTHLTESMSIYYQRGCSAGGYNMTMKSPELGKEFKKAMNDAQWISYLNEVLYSSEKLHGGHGERVTTKSKANDPDRIIYRQTAEETMQKAKKGLISYQRTPLGGCASSKPCNERAHGNFTSCFGCASSVLKASNVKSVIDHAQIDLMELDPKSFEYRMEQRNIQDYEFILNHLN